MSHYTDTLQASIALMTDALQRLDSQQQASLDLALRGGATLGIETQLLPVPAVFMVLQEREGARRMLAEILPAWPTGAGAGPTIQ